MKILITCDPEIPVPPTLYGGIERIVDVLVEAYVSFGHDVTLCAHPDSKVPCRLVGWKGARSQNFMDTLRNTIQLSLLVAKHNYDVVHSFSRLAYLTGIMPFSIPKIMSYQREPSLQQISKAVKLSKKGTIIFSGCSDYITDKIKTVANAQTIYNCISINKFNFSKQVNENAPLVFLGRIEDIKGTHIAIEVARITGKNLIIAGNIPVGKEAYFENEVKPFLNDRVSYIGPVNDVEKNNILGSAYAFLMPIQWNEPFGIVMAEALACGTPVIGFPYGSVPEVVDHGITGYICSNVQEMAAAVKKVSLLDRTFIRKTAEERFSSTKVAMDYIELYTSML